MRFIVEEVPEPKLAHVQACDHIVIFTSQVKWQSPCFGSFWRSILQRR